MLCLQVIVLIQGVLDQRGQTVILTVLFKRLQMIVDHVYVLADVVHLLISNGALCDTLLQVLAEEGEADQHLLDSGNLNLWVGALD